MTDSAATLKPCCCHGMPVRTSAVHHHCPASLLDVKYLYSNSPLVVCCIGTCGMLHGVGPRAAADGTPAGVEHLSLNLAGSKAEHKQAAPNALCRSTREARKVRTRSRNRCQVLHRLLHSAPHVLV
jgi:hypothetical protein